MRSEFRSPTKSTSKAEKGGAPEWHFADEGAEGSADKQKSSFGATLRENRFFLRALVALIFVICLVYIFNYKEASALNKTYKPSTWFSVKPHWQTTEELRHRMRVRTDRPHPDRFPGETQEEYIDYQNNAEQWLMDMNSAAEADLKAAGLDNELYDYDAIP